MMNKRNRLIYALCLILVILLGIGSRRYAVYLPALVATYGGDILWGLMIYMGFGFLFPNASIKKVMLYGGVFSYIIEFSQLYQAQWIVTIRRTTLGGLILGFGFLWSDLLCYTIGILLGVLIERYILLNQKA